jgi:isopenicillin N synthase-like dioxygenase
MTWSDDRFKSTFHRVKTPCEADDFYGERYSIAFFNQPCKDVVIQGPRRKYAPVTGEEFTRRAMRRNYEALERRRVEREEAERAVKEHGVRGAEVQEGRVVADVGALGVT